MRQAVNYALNREALVRIYGGLAKTTENVLPPTYPQYKKLNLYPYNLAKAYERRRTDLDEYVRNQAEVIAECVRILRPGGSLCWEVGNPSTTSFTDTGGGYGFYMEIPAFGPGFVASVMVPLPTMGVPTAVAPRNSVAVAPASTPAMSKTRLAALVMLSVLSEPVSLAA